MPDAPVLRDAELLDAEAVRALLAALHGGADPWAAADPAHVAATFERIVSDPLRRLRLAIVDGEPAGLVDTAILPNLSRGARPLATIANVVVDPSRQRLGLGRLLIEDAVAFAAGHGCYKVELVSGGARDGAHEFYASVGFIADVRGFRRYLVAV